MKKLRHRPSGVSWLWRNAAAIAAFGLIAAGALGAGDDECEDPCENPIPCSDYAPGPAIVPGNIYGIAGDVLMTNQTITYEVPATPPTGWQSWDGEAWRVHFALYQSGASDIDNETRYMRTQNPTTCECGIAAYPNPIPVAAPGVVPLWTTNLAFAPGAYELKCKWDDILYTNWCWSDPNKTRWASDPPTADKKVNIFMWKLSAAQTPVVKEFPQAITLQAVIQPGPPAIWGTAGVDYEKRWIINAPVGGVNPYVTTGSLNASFTPDAPGSYSARFEFFNLMTGVILAQMTLPVTSWKFEVASPMVLPADPASNNFGFSGSTPGILTVPHDASLTPISAANYVQSIVWTTNFSGAQSYSFSPSQPGDPQSGDGLHPTLTVTGLPPNNDQFGRHVSSVTLTMQPQFGGQRQANAHYDAFFPTTGLNWPGYSGEAGQGPNWYFYWKQTSANAGTHYYVESLNGAWGLTYWQNPIFLISGANVTVDGELYYIRDLGRSLFPLTFTPRGIDRFARTCRHESRHVHQWQNHGPDSDGDWLTNAYENASGGSPLTFDLATSNTTSLGRIVIGSPPNQFAESDFEADSEDEYVRGTQGEGSWAIGSALSVNWSTMTSGGQWTTY